MDSPAGAEIRSMVSSEAVAAVRHARYSAFLSHRQQETSDRCNNVFQELRLVNAPPVWFDLAQEKVTRATMEAGVRESALFVLFASTGYLDSKSCLHELGCAIREGKTILLVYDEYPVDTWCITDEILWNWLASLYDCCSDTLLSLGEFQGLLTRNKHCYGVRRGSEIRTSMLNAIISLSGGPPNLLSVKAPALPEDPLLSEVIIVCHSKYGIDQSELVAIGLISNGISASVLYDDAFISNILATSRTLKGIIVFLTKAVFQQSLPKETVRAARKLNKPLVGLFAADTRMNNALDFAEVRNDAQDDPDLLAFLDEDHVRFAQYDRKSDEFKRYIEQRVLGRLNIDIIFKEINYIPSFHVAAQKALLVEAGTREWLNNELQDRLTKTPLVILAADAGMGKSCIMGSIAKRHCANLARYIGSVSEDDGSYRVGAIYFFQYYDSTERRAETCIYSISKQLCATVHGFRSALPTKDGSVVRWLNELEVEAKNMRNNVERLRFLFSELVIKPSTNVADPPQSCVLIIDALDECAESDSLGQAIAQLWSDGSMNTKPNQAPSWLKLLVSTRRESHTMERFRSYKPVELLQDLAENEDDLRNAVSHRIGRWNFELSDDEKQEVTEMILAKSQGVFLWLQYQEDALMQLAEEHDLTAERIEKSLPKGLMGVYIEFFTRVKRGFEELGLKYKESENERIRTIVKHLYDKALAIGVLVPREPIPQDLWRDVLGFDTKSKDMAMAYQDACTELSKLLIFDSSTQTIRAPHKSMVDFLKFDPDKIGVPLELMVEENESNIILGRKMLQVAENLKRKSWETGGYTCVEQYSLRHLLHHLIEGGSFDEASRPFLSVALLIRLYDVAQLYNDVPRVVLEGERLLDFVQNGQREWRDKVQYILKVSRMAEPALRIDARMLPSQILGRAGIPPFDVEQQYYVHQARAWLDEVSRQSGPKIAQPVHFGFSGLEPAGGPLLRTVKVEAGLSIVLIDIKHVAIGNHDEWMVVANDREVTLFETATGNKLRTCYAESHCVIHAVAMPSDSTWIVMGCSDNTASVFDLQSGNGREFKGHSASVGAVAVSSDSKLIVTGSDDKTARVWDFESGKEVRVLEGHSDSVGAVAISFDSKLIVTGSNDKTARVWDLHSGKAIKVLKGSQMKTVAISADSKWVVTTGLRENTARVWDLKSGKQVKTLKHSKSGSLDAVAISPDSKWIVTANSVDNTATVWSLQSGRQVKVLEGHSGCINTMAISADSKRLVTGSWVDMTVRLWDLQSKKMPNVLAGHPDHKSGVAIPFVISPDSRWVVSRSGDKTFRVWDIGAGKVKILKGHSDDIQTCVISPDSKWVVTGSWDNTARVWDLQKGKVVKVLKGHSAVVEVVAISPDSKWIVTGSEDCTARVWDLQKGKKVKVLKGHVAMVVAVAFSSDSRWIVTGGDESVRVWDFQTGKELKVFSHTMDIRSVAISSDSKWLVTESGYYETVRVWDLEGEKEVIEAKDDIIRTVTKTGDSVLQDKGYISGASSTDVGFVLDPGCYWPTLNQNLVFGMTEKGCCFCWRLAED